MDNKEILGQIIAQILGFLLVFFILKQFAWKKLLGMIDARRQKIQASFSEIENQKESLAVLEKDYRLRLESIEHEARVKIQQASAEGLRVAKDIEEKAKVDSEKLVEKARFEIEQDLLKAKLKIRDEIVEVSALMTEKILKEKMDPKAHEKLVHEFIKEIEKIS